MNLLFLMDPLATVNYHKDTTFILMKAAEARGHRVYYLPKNGLISTRDQFTFTVTPVTTTTNPDSPFSIEEPVTLTEDDVQCVFIRTDPPVDTDYHAELWLLNRLAQRVLVVNNPAGIQIVNEKLWATQFTDITPKTLVSSRAEDHKQFLHSETASILKPINGFGGQGIYKLSPNDSNLNVILESSTLNGTAYCISQELVPEASIGDKRILLLNGDVLGAVLRVHGKEDHRNNLFAGGHTEASTVTKEDRKIVETLSPHLKALGLFFVGIDVIGGKLIEVNVTSPTCLQELVQHDDKAYHLQVIEALENLV